MSTGVTILENLAGQTLERITAAFYFNLRRQMKGFSKATDGMLRMLIRYALQTVSYTAIISIPVDDCRVLFFGHPLMKF